MSRHCSKARLVLLCGAALAAPACIAPSDPAEELEASPERTVRVITADDTAPLGPDQRLVLDLRTGEYRIDMSAGSVELTHVDVIDATGRLGALEELAARQVEAGRVSGEQLARGFAVKALGGEALLTALAVNGLELVSKASESSSEWWRSPEAYCTGDNALLGPGAALTANGNVLFRGIRPYQGNAPYAGASESGAQEDLQGTTSSWTLTTFGICGALPSGYIAVHTQSSYSSSATRSWTTSCPSGKKVIGAGGMIWQGEGRVKVDEIRPNETLDQVTVTASEDPDGTGDAWSLSAYAICAYAPPGLVRVKATAANAWNGTAVVATCPSEKRLLGVGGGVSATDMRRLRIYSMRPSSDLSSATVRVTTKGSTSGVTGEVRSYAICADG